MNDQYENWGSTATVTIVRIEEENVKTSMRIKQGRILAKQ